MKRTLTIIMVATLFLGCKNDKNKKLNNDLKNVSFIQEWFPNANYAGELLAMYEFDDKEGLNIDVQAGSYDIDPIKMVISGTNEFGIVSADRLIEANEKGADLRAIAIANYKSPTCFISKKSTPLNTLKDFNGKKVGILTGTNTEIIYNILKEKANIIASEEMEAPFDLNTFLLGEYEIRPAFAYDEPVSLELQNIEYNILYPEDFGVNFIGTVYLCKSDMIENNPKIVEAFVNSLEKGWNEAFANNKKAIEYLKKFDSEIDINRETKSLEKALPYFEGENGKILWASKATWEQTANVLIKSGKIKSFDFNKNVNYSFLNE